MAGWKRGTRVVFDEPLRRGRWHKHGAARVRQGKKGVVVGSRRQWGKERRYDVAIPDRGHQQRLIRAVPASKLSRRTSAFPASGVLVLLVLVAVAVVERG